MFLSVVVPYYNVELYLRQCLESIAAQDVTDLEVILVDDGSTDGSRAVAEEFVAGDPRFRIVTQHNQGLGPARNTGTAAATGRYLTFVDSDDLVPRRGWQRMLASLERSGSDFALGDARRFDLYAVRGSWLHKQYVHRTQQRTGVLEQPALANDRMVWNKIYRRSFWDAGGYEFPAMLYEDYPVTLRAHLEARAVDIVADPVYLWRERDGGEHSITQRALELANVRDRFDSAVAVLDLADGATPEVRREVQHHLLGPDVGTMLRAIALPANEPDVPALLAMANALLDRIDEDVLARRRPLERLGYGLLRHGGVEQVRAWQRVRVQTPPPAGHTTTGLLRRRRLLDFPGVDLSGVSESARLVSARELDLDGRVLEARWDGDSLGLQVRLWAHFAPPGARPRVTAWLARDGRRVPVSVGDVRSDGASVLASLSVPGPEVAAAGPGDWQLLLRLRTGEVTRTGPLTRIAAGSATFGSPWCSGSGTWLVPGRDFDDRYVVRAIRPDAVLTDVTSGRAGEIALAGSSARPLPLDGALLRVASAGQDQPRDVQVPLIVDPSEPTRWQARVQLGAVTTPIEQADELLDPRTEQRLSLLVPGAEHRVLLAPGLPVARFAHRHREVQVMGSRFLEARIDEVRPQLAIESATAHGARMTLAGRWLDERTAVGRTVLRWHYLAERPEEIELRLDFDGDAFTAEVDLDLLGARVAEVLAAQSGSRWAIDDIDAPPVTKHDWLLSFSRAGREESVQLTSSLARALPEPWPTAGGLVSLSTHERLAARFVVAEPTRPGTASA